MEKDIEIKEEKTRKEWIAPESTEIKEASSTENGGGFFFDLGTFSS